MCIFKSFFATIGFITFFGMALIFYKGNALLKEFDSEAPQVYKTILQSIIESKSIVEATVWKTKVEQDLSAEDVEEAMKSVANELNLANVGELPLSTDVTAKTGKEYRFVKIFMFCDSLIASKMMNYKDAFSAYLPCRISLIKDKTGQLWLYSLNMDLMIHGGAPLPPKLKREALKVKKNILEIMQRGAEGDF